MTAPASNARVALVTGGVRGIGRAVVDALVADGWLVAFTYRSDHDAARALETSHSGHVRGFTLDLRDRDRPDPLVREVTAALGPITGLVNNAGVRHDSLLAMTPDADWDNVQEINASGAFRCCRAVLPGMTAQRHGAIVNVSSLAAISGFAGQSAYAASKASLIGMSKSLAREMAKRRIRVNVVVPGFVATDMTAEMPDRIREELRDLECLPDGTTAEDVAAVVAFLLSDRAKAVTGQVIAVDAGSSA